MDDRADVASTLNELERKLKALEGDLQAAAQPPSIDPDPVPAFSAPEPEPEADDAALAGDPQEIVAEARRRIAELRTELDELARTREQLAQTASELVADYNRALAASPPRPAEPGIRQPATGAPEYQGGFPAYSEPPHPALGPEHTLQQGTVTIDAGFFRDVTTVSTFEQSLARIPGVAGIVVREFAQGRAQIDVQLSQPVALGSELIRYAPLRLTVTEAGPHHLMLAVAG